MENKKKVGNTGKHCIRRTENFEPIHDNDGNGRNPRSDRKVERDWKNSVRFQSKEEEDNDYGQSTSRQVRGGKCTKKPLLLPSIDCKSVPRILIRNNSLSRWTLNKYERRVMVLYTGGTIGMVKSSGGGLLPSANTLEKTIRTFPYLHDKEYARSRFGDLGDDGVIGESPLALPLLEDSQHRVTYTIFEYDPLLDSSQMTMDDWIRIANDIKENYEAFDGFVVLHGTDTLAYTASALSFMMEHLGKNVIITGSQIPLYQTRSDGRDNFLGALILASNYSIPEVCVYFGNKLFRGNRTTKVSSDSLNAFDSPNMSPLATVGISIHVDYNGIFRPKDISSFQVHTTMNRNVGLLRLFPSITLETVRVFLQPPTEGVVLQTYGAGNFPTNRTDLLDELSEAAKRGVLIVNCTQCGHGAVSSIYETGLTAEMGITAGWDMTPEAALTKLCYLLACKDLTVAQKRELIGTNIRGELSKTPTMSHHVVAANHRDFIDKNNQIVPATEASLINASAKQSVINQVVGLVANSLGFKSTDEANNIKNSVGPTLMCAFVSQISKLSRTQHSSNVTTYLNALFKNSEADVNTADYCGRTPLHVAASLGDYQVLEYLLKSGASVHVRDQKGCSPLQEAIENDHHRCIKLLKQVGGHVAHESTVVGNQVCLAASNGDVVRLMSYKLAGTDLNQLNRCGRTPIHEAVAGGSLKAVEWLLKTGNVDLEVTDTLGLTPLQLAKEISFREAVKLLQNWGNNASKRFHSANGV